MSIQALRQQYEELEAKKAELAAAIERFKEEGKAQVVASIKAHIAEHGYALEEIVSELAPQSPATRAKRTAPGRGERPAYPTYRLKSDARKTYIRGVLPVWLKEAISAAGLDPSRKEDRERFKAEHMEREAA